MSATAIAILGMAVSLLLAIIGAVFKMGHHSARLESLEAWRANIRLDMHEISDKLDAISEQMSKISTLVDERTERRKPSA